MTETSEQLLCACGCGYPIVELRNGHVLVFRKKGNQQWHFLAIPLPEGADLSRYPKRPSRLLKALEHNPDFKARKRRK